MVLQTCQFIDFPPQPAHSDPGIDVPLELLFHLRKESSLFDPRSNRTCLSMACLSTGRSDTYYAQIGGSMGIPEDVHDEDDGVE